jgi:hypothetical protein
MLSRCASLRFIAGFRRGVLDPGSADPSASCQIMVPLVSPIRVRVSYLRERRTTPRHQQRVGNRPPDSVLHASAKRPLPRRTRNCCALRAHECRRWRFLRFPLRRRKARRYSGRRRHRTRRTGCADRLNAQSRFGEPSGSRPRSRARSHGLERCSLRQVRRALRHRRLSLRRFGEEIASILRCRPPPAHAGLPRRR